MKKSSTKKGKGVLIVVAVIVLVALLFLFVPKNSTGELTQGLEELENQESTSTEYIVERTLEGFVPKILEIKQGDKITWINKLAYDVQPASDFHPTHTSYPGSSIVKCGTSEENQIFDACRGLRKGESYSFVFNEIGSWSYHDHLKPSKNGKIIVS